MELLSDIAPSPFPDPPPSSNGSVAPQDLPPCTSPLAPAVDHTVPEAIDDPVDGTLDDAVAENVEVQADNGTQDHCAAPDAHAGQILDEISENGAQQLEPSSASAPLVDTLQGETIVPTISDESVVESDGAGVNGGEANGSGHVTSVERSDDGWTNGADSSAEGSFSGWISADNHTAHVAAELPLQRVVPISRRHTFFIVKMPRTADSKLRNKIRLAELQLEEACKNRDFIRAALQLKRASKTELVEKLKIVRDKERACREATQKKLMEIDPLQAALNKFKVAHSTTRGDICSSEEELNDRIAYLQHRIQHESIPLKEEKQLIRERKYFESTRSQIVANVAVQTELIETLGPKEDIKVQYDILDQELRILRHHQAQARAECGPVESELQNLNVTMDDLVKQLEHAKHMQHEAFVACKDLKKLQGEQNYEFYKNKDDIRKARELASTKRVEDLEVLCREQVEGILSHWNTDASFREKYLKNNEPSTVKRLQTLDGRSLGPDEEPVLLMGDVDMVADSVIKADVVVSEVSSQTKPSTAVGRTKVSKVPVDESKVPAQLKVSKVPADESKVPAQLAKAVLQERLAEEAPVSETKEGEARISKTSKVKNSSSLEGTTNNTNKANSGQVEDAAIKEAEVAELKEKRRQEEMAKAREAAERKKRQAERAQAKALLRAQKEAERREKEREKRARKKAAASTTELESTEASSQSESTEIAATPEELPKDSSAALKVFPQRRKPSGKRPKVPRQVAMNSLPKKGIWPFPIWVWLILAGILLSLLLALLIFL